MSGTPCQRKLLSQLILLRVMKYGKYHCYSSYCFVYKMIIVAKVQLLSGRKLAKGARRQIVCHLIYYESENNLACRQFMLFLQRKILISRQPSPFYYKPSITAFLLEWKFCTCNKHMAHPPKVFTTQPLSGKKKFLTPVQTIWTHCCMWTEDCHMTHFDEDLSGCWAQCELEGG